MIDAVSKIKLLKQIQPDQNWLKAQREILLEEIYKSGKKSNKFNWNGLPAFLFPQNILKPALAMGLFLCLFFGGGFITVLAAKDSLPGDLLYPVKITLENIKVKVSSQEEQSKIQAQLIEIRVEELSQIINVTSDPVKKQEQINKTIDNLQTQITSTKAHLDRMKDAEADKDKAVQIADIVTEKTAQSEEILAGAKEKLTQEAQNETSKEVAEAIDAAAQKIKETSVLAAELKQAKTGIEVKMEVEETTEPEVEEINQIIK